MFTFVSCERRFIGDIRGWLLHSTTYTLKSQIRYKKTRKIALKKAVKKLAFLNSLFVSAIKLRGVIRD